MSADKNPSIFSRQMETTVYIADRINNLPFKEGDTYYYGSKECSS